MSRSHCARRVSTHPSLRRHLAVELLEARVVLSSAGPLPNLSGSLPEAVVSTDPAATVALVEPADPGDDALPDIWSTPVRRLPRLTGLRVLPTAAWLLRSRRQAASADTTTQGNTTTDGDFRAAAVAVGDDDPFSTLSPTSKYCRSYSLRLCKVPLDTDVDPMLKCPGVDAAFCLPQMPIRSSSPYSGTDAGGQLNSKMNPKSAEGGAP